MIQNPESGIPDSETIFDCARRWKRWAEDQGYGDHVARLLHSHVLGHSMELMMRSAIAERHFTTREGYKILSVARELVDEYTATDEALAASMKRHPAGKQVATPAR